MRKLFLIVSGLMVSLALAAALLRTRAEPSLIHAAGLDGPVTLVRDRWGVAHLFASDQHDLFLAQGYLNAQDRPWQLLARRQAANGRLSDWLGAHAAGADALLAGQDFYRTGSQCTGWEELDLDARQALEAYTDGINAYLDRLQSVSFAGAGAWSIEMAVLKSRGIPTRPFERWTVQDSLAIACMIDWAQGLSETKHLDRELVERLGSERAAELLAESSPHMAAPYSPELRLVLQLAAIPLRSDFPQPEGQAPLATSYSAPVIPPAWTMTGLHSPSYEAAGASIAGLPGVVAGRGAERAWDIRWSEQALEAGNAALPCPVCVALDEMVQAPQDTPSELAQCLTPYLTALETRGWLQERVTSMMSKWDCRLEAGSAPAAVYEAWLAALGRRALADELGAELHARYAASGHEAAALARLAAQPASPWWDDVTTAQREGRDEIMQLAYADALDYLGRHYGDLHTIWEWGQMHAATFEHALGGDGPGRLLNRGPIPLGGDGASDPGLPFNPSLSFEPALVPALRWRFTGSQGLSFALPASSPARRAAAWRHGRPASISRCCGTRRTLSRGT